MKKQQTLEDILRDPGFSPAQCVHIAVDVQKECCAGFEEAASRITGEVAPALGALGIQTYWLYYDPENEGQEKARGGFHGVTPHPRDRVIRKKTMSAMEESDTRDALKEDRKNVLILSGFYYHKCLLGTALDALDEGYEVIVLDDCSGTPYDAPFMIAQKGGVIARSGDVIELLQAKAREKNLTASPRDRSQRPALH